MPRSLLALDYNTSFCYLHDIRNIPSDMYYLNIRKDIKPRLSRELKAPTLYALQARNVVIPVLYYRFPATLPWVSGQPDVNIPLQNFEGEERNRVGIQWWEERGHRLRERGVRFFFQQLLNGSDRSMSLMHAFAKCPSVPEFEAHP